MIRRRRLGLALGALLALAACGGPVPPPVTLPPAAGNPFADPARQAINATAFGFARTDTLAGNPAEAASLIGQAEFLAVELATGQRWISFAPRVQQEFAAARVEWRMAAGIAPDAAPQAVIDALFAARTALMAGDRAAAAAALPAPLFREDALARLSALPPLPRSAAAGSEAQSEMWRDQVQIEAEP